MAELEPANIGQASGPRAIFKEHFQNRLRILMVARCPFKILFGDSRTGELCVGVSLCVSPFGREAAPVSILRVSLQNILGREDMDKVLSG